MKTNKRIGFSGFIKFISLLFVPIAILGFYEFIQIPLLKLTRPSAFYQVAYLLSFIPTAIFVGLANTPIKWKFKLFKSSESDDRFINIILSLQMLGSISYVFLELRYSYFEWLIYKSSYQWGDIFLALFYIFIYLYIYLIVLIAANY